LWEGIEGEKVEYVSWSAQAAASKSIPAFILAFICLSLLVSFAFAFALDFGFFLVMLCRHFSFEVR
jgi:hypothetical protein